MTSASIPLVDLSEDNEVTVVTRWDTELRKKGSYKIAVSILSGRKFGAPSLAVMHEMLDVIDHQPFQDFFLNNLEQAKSFDDLKKVLVFKCTSKTARFRKWTVHFVSDKLALLMELNQQVVNEKTAREKETGHVGHAPPKTKLRRAILKLVKEYSESCRLYEEDQRLLKNGLIKTPSLNLQKSGTRLQDNFIFDPTTRDLTACPVCHHVSTQILECQLANNRAARAAASVAGGDGKFDGLSSKHGCFCHAIHCRGQQNGGNCPECMMPAQQDEIRAVVGPGSVPTTAARAAACARRYLRSSIATPSPLPLRGSVSKRTLPKRRLRRRLSQCSRDTSAMLSRIITRERCSITTRGTRMKYSSITHMVDRTRLKATGKMIDLSSTPRTKKRACIVRVVLAERNQSFVSIIKDTLPACSQEALDVCMLQASLQE